ncbi:hypothetical protein A6A19_02465 [Actinobacillus delphinicola]|uniref:peptidoglycan DD-metalloendopeptidase family protein n=1 Tax=Actinobacillus delphinicola TaxID=51161 RepID=UPI0024429BC5|nr:peptidoglycan DD-metalloendopeptidase family protein [Actinobacillus delphinicola]MDG6896890.1 hypothetical protein [Actinobacillus delphinicola]
MKKLFILPIAATVLSACSMQKPAPVVNVGSGDQGLNNPATTNSQIIDTRWNEEVKQLPMADNMPTDVAYNKMSSSRNDLILDNNFYIPRTVQGTPNYNKLVKGSYKARQYQVKQGDSLFLISYISGIPVDQIVKLNHLPKPYSLHVGQVLMLAPNESRVTDKDVASVQPIADKKVYIPRNPRTNKPEYNRMTKGFYHGNTYTVNKGDTLYLVSYISGQDVKEIARLNHLRPPYDLHAGQVIKLLPTSGNYRPVPESPVETRREEVRHHVAPATTHSARVAQTTKNTSQQHFMNTLLWQWPTTGKIIDSYSYADGGNKGIDIAGQLGQPVRAAAAGQVVYAGNALQGYGNLIIIKHNDDYLSAYAHNQKILVKDKQWVKAGQEIATMGDSGSNRVELHFEVRYKGQSTDPMRYLPKQQ